MNSDQNMHPLLKALLRQCVERKATDLHLTPGQPPFYRMDGELSLDEESKPLSQNEMSEVITQTLDASQIEALRNEKVVDLARSLENGERFRIHLFLQRRGASLTARMLDNRFRTWEELKLPNVMERLVGFESGLVLITGPTGSGKTTTLSSLLHHIHQSRACHILTLEDPVEYVHGDGLGLVQQREFHSDFSSFSDAVRASLREDPDVILVGEMRDPETMRAAIAVAETGHLVFSTLHCGDTVGALDRLLGAFPGTEQESLCQQLSMTLRAVIAQKLLPHSEGRGLVPAVEILMVNSAVANLIRGHRSQQIYSSIENGSVHGMQTMDQSLAQIVAKGWVSEKMARRSARDQKMFDERLQNMKGVRPVSI